MIAVTLGCNSRCKTCDIWMIQPEGEMRPADYRRLPRSLRDSFAPNSGSPLAMNADQAITDHGHENHHRAT